MTPAPVPQIIRVETTSSVNIVETSRQMEKNMEKEKYLTSARETDTISNFDQK